jgi:biopolymer transport protein ExbB
VRDEGKKRLVFGLDAGKPYLEVADGALPARIAASQPIDGGTWHHLAFVAGDRAAVYVDGDEVAQGSLKLPEFHGDVVVGAAAGLSGVAAEIDELRIANRMRAPESIRAAALAEHPQSRLVQYGGDEGGGGNDYLAVLQTLARAVSNDGWAIIGLIAIMGFVSGDVMLSKMRLLARIGRQNDAFVAEFRRPESGLARLDAEASAAAARWSEGSLYRVYRAAHDELQSLRQAGQGGALGAVAIEIVRAGMDV